MNPNISTTKTNANKGESIFIGVDGGATKSKVIIENNAGALLGQARGDAATIRFGAQQAWQNIMATIKIAMQQAGLSLEDKRYNFHLGLGLAGCEIPDKYQEFLEIPHPFANRVLVSDAHAACLGAHGGADGAIIIIGTGVIGYQIQGGKTLQVSGWGFSHDDFGGGAWLGLQAISLTLQWRDGRIEKPSPLLESVWERFGKDLSQLVPWANAANSTRFAEIAPLVLQQIEKQDPFALQLIQQAARYVDDVGAAIVRGTSDQQKLPCALFGGVSTFIEPWLGAELSSRLVSRKHDATRGAILALKKEKLV